MKEQVKEYIQDQVQIAKEMEKFIQMIENKLS
jgi:hypothetical protein